MENETTSNPKMMGRPCIRPPKDVLESLLSEDDITVKELAQVLGYCQLQVDGGLISEMPENVSKHFAKMNNPLIENDKMMGISDGVIDA